MGIPYIIAPEESDSQCAYLTKELFAYGVGSEDMDILTFGSPKIIRNLTSSKKIPLEIELDKVLNELNFTYEQFVELCILFGCDYCTNLNDVKYNVMFEIYNKHKTYKINYKIRNPNRGPNGRPKIYHEEEEMVLSC